MKNFSLGIDFGSNSARALIIDVETGKEYGKGASIYAGGDNGVYVSETNHHLARQNPDAYLESMTKAVTQAVEEASGCDDGFAVENIVGIGVAATASTPLPVDKNMVPLSRLDRFKDNLNAKAWMWKDHTSMEEAAKITELASEIRPEYLAKCGGAFSSEWFFAKIWHCMNIDKEVFDSAYSWIEFCDFIPAVLTGLTDPLKIKRSICAAGHKALYNTQWGGLPDAEFLSALDPRLAALLPRLYSEAFTSDNTAGCLCSEWAERLKLKQGIPVAVGSIDAHLGAVGAGVGNGRLVKIIGTSTCDIMAEPATNKLPDIPGVAGIAEGSVIPGCYGIEAGQSAVGDIFNWFVSKVCSDDHSIFKRLTAEAEKLRPGQSGLLALDWNNGNRNILADQKLTGLIAGMTLQSSQSEIYRALIEATAFGAKKIIDRLEEYGVHINEIICCGGIAEKNPMFMQIYSDVLDRPMKVSASSETCALGAAIYGAVTGGAYEKVEDMQGKICAFKDTVYLPEPENVETYKRLFALYSELHDSFGLKGKSFDHYNVMKELLDISASSK